jgi:hypothetical protein
MKKPKEPKGTNGKKPKEPDGTNGKTIIKKSQRNRKEPMERVNHKVNFFI